MNRKFASLFREPVIEVLINLVHPILLLISVNRLDNVFIVGFFPHCVGGFCDSLKVLLVLNFINSKIKYL